MQPIADELKIPMDQFLTGLIDTSRTEYQGDPLIRILRGIIQSITPEGYKSGFEGSIKDGYYRKLSKIESGDNPNARNKLSGAGGLYQFMPATAAAYGLKNVYDRVESREAVERFTNDNRKYLIAQLGREPIEGELYLAHQQGPKGAADLLLNASEKAASIVGRQAVLQNGGTLDMTAGEFANLWIKRFQEVTVP
jgi:hypothetical protein